MAVKFSSHPENQGNTVMPPKSSSKSKGFVSVCVATRQRPLGKRPSQQRHQSAGGFLPPQPWALLSPQPGMLISPPSLCCFRAQFYPTPSALPAGFPQGGSSDPPWSSESRSGPSSLVPTPAPPLPTASSPFQSAACSCWIPQRSWVKSERHQRCCAGMEGRHLGWKCGCVEKKLQEVLSLL